MFDRTRAFVNGVWEFRSDWTKTYMDHNLLYWYDLGRETAHRLTFRLFDV